MLDTIIKCIQNREYMVSLHYWNNLLKDSTRPLPSAIIASIGDDKPEIIEDYPEDSRGACCLVLGFDKQGKGIHTVIGYDRDPIKIVTAYHPSYSDWINYRTRRT